VTTPLKLGLEEKDKCEEAWRYILSVCDEEERDEYINGTHL
jgi:hypothetical protein